MKKIILFVFALLLVMSGIMAQQNSGLPRVPQTESYVVTPSIRQVVNCPQGLISAEQQHRVGRQPVPTKRL